MHKEFPVSNTDSPEAEALRPRPAFHLPRDEEGAVAGALHAVAREGHVVACRNRKIDSLFIITVKFDQCFNNKYL